MSLACESDVRFAAGVTAFERGAYFEAHEHWESLWLEARGDERACLAGLIQLAAGFYKLDSHDSDHGATNGARRLLARGLARLETRRALPTSGDVATWMLRARTALAETPRHPNRRQGER